MVGPVISLVAGSDMQREIVQFDSTLRLLAMRFCSVSSRPW